MYTQRTHQNMIFNTKSKSVVSECTHVIDIYGTIEHFV